LPLHIDLDRAGDVSVVAARRSDALAVARVLIAQLAAFHAPGDVRLAVVAPAAAEPDWEWVRWLPPLLDTDRIGPAGPSPLLVEDMAALQALLADDLAERARAAATTHRYGGGTTEARTRPRLLVVDDSHGHVARALAVPDPSVGLAAAGITAVHLLADRLHEPGEVSRRLEVADGQVALTDRTATPATVFTGTVDEIPAPLAEALARRVAPLRLSPDSYDDGSGTPPADFTTLLGLDDSGALDLDRSWHRRGERDLLRVPIGVDPAGRPVVLDLKESAQLGMGPHGLCVGATGSGNV
jgi:S-DNA-T family DNA segregation ATPase FtsK/SpoIIIE